MMTELNASELPAGADLSDPSLVTETFMAGPALARAIRRASQIKVQIRKSFTQPDDPPFRNARAAVIFAVNREGAPARPLQSRMVDATGERSRELSGLDGAAQAGMILNVLDGLGQVAVAALKASCGTRTVPCSCRSACCSGAKINREWRDAVERLAQEAIGWTDGASYSVCRAVIIKIYGQKKSFVEIAQETGTDAAECGTHHKVILRKLMGGKAGRHGDACEGIESTAWAEAETLLRHFDIVG